MSNIILEFHFVRMVHVTLSDEIFHLNIHLILRIVVNNVTCMWYMYVVVVDAYIHLVNKLYMCSEV